MMQVMRLVDDQHDRLLALAHQGAQRAFAHLSLFRDRRILVRRQVAEQGCDQRAECGPALLDRHRLRHDDPVVLGQQLLQPAHDRLAGTDHPAQRHQVAVVDGLFDVLQQLAMMRGLVVPEGARRARQAVELHHLSPHARRLLATLDANLINQRDSESDTYASLGT